MFTFSDTFTKYINTFGSKWGAKSLYRSLTGRHLYGTEYEIWADFGQVGNTEKKIWADYEQLLGTIFFQVLMDKQIFHFEHSLKE